MPVSVRLACPVTFHALGRERRHVMPVMPWRCDAQYSQYSTYCTAGDAAYSASISCLSGIPLLL